MNDLWYVVAFIAVPAVLTGFCVGWFVGYNSGHSAGKAEMEEPDDQ